MLSENQATDQRLTFFDFHGKRTMWVDYSKSGEEQMIHLLEQAVDLGWTVGDELNILANFKSTPKCPEFNRRLKAHGKKFYHQGVVVKVAILGIDSPLKRVVVNATMAITRIKNVKLFEHKEDALNWIIS